MKRILTLIVLMVGINSAFAERQVLSAITAAVKERCRQIMAAGQLLGRNLKTFSKIGDSITISASFLSNVGCGGGIWDVADTAQYKPIVRWFSEVDVRADGANWCGGRDCFSIYSNSAAEGWIVQDATGRGHYNTDPDNAPLYSELAATNPCCAIIMYGTNDLRVTNDTSVYRSEYKFLIDTLIGSGVIPILSTIPEFTSTNPSYTGFGTRVEGYNNVVISLGQEYQIPVVDFNWSCKDLPDFGLSSDGIHPSCGTNSGGYVDGSDFTLGATKGGYNMRGYTAIKMLEKVKRIIIDDGAPDPDSGTSVIEPQEKRGGLALSCSPNPFNPEVRICGQGLAAGNELIMVHIYDSQGKRVHMAAVNSSTFASGISWNASALASGVYLVHASRAGKTATVKAILSR